MASKSSHKRCKTVAPNVSAVIGKNSGSGSGAACSAKNFPATLSSGKENVLQEINDQTVMTPVPLKGFKGKGKRNILKEGVEALKEVDCNASPVGRSLKIIKQEKNETTCMSIDQVEWLY